jgi:PAS domain S-box-containing protein
MLLLVLFPIVFLAGAVGIGWLAFRLPSTVYAEHATIAIVGLAALEGLFAWLMLLVVMPGYLKYSKKALIALEGGERYVRALTGAGIGFWEIDMAKKRVFLSGQMMRMLGYSDQERNDEIDFWYKSIHPEEVEGVKRAIDFHLQDRTPEYSIEYRIKRANGEYLWVSDKGRAVPTWSSKPSTRIAGVTEDISNIRRVEEVLKARTDELEEAQGKIMEEVRNVRKFQKAVDSSTEAVSITTPDGAIIYVNKAWMDLNHFTDAEALGRNPRMLKSDKTAPDIFQALWEKISAGMPFYTEDLFNKRKDGSEYQAGLSIFPIREGDSTIFYVSICQDITQRKEVDRAKTEFVSLASHQLRTPLSAIRWYSEMLLSKYVGELNEKQRQYVNEIYAGNLRMVDLVNALLNVSRIDLGTFAIEPEPVSLVEICDSVLTELAPQILERKQSVEKVFSAAPKTYNADPKLIRMVFQNFLSNSVKYTQPGGHVIVEISARETELYIRVTDNGYGIPKSQHGKMFEKLFRADNVRQKDTEGTGLGMYIIKAIVENSGGKIWFDSEENKGTTFHVLLPIVGMPRKGGAKGLS